VRTEGELAEFRGKASAGIFADYRLRVCDVTAGINNPDKMLLLTSWKTSQ